MAQKITTYQTAEFGKFVELSESSAFPPVSVVRISYPDTTNAFPSNSGVDPLSSVEVYPKYAVLTKLTNPEDIKVTLSAGNVDITVDPSSFAATNSKLDVLTGIDYATEFKQDAIITLIQSLSTVNRINGFVIPDYNRIRNYYYGTSNNVSKIDYISNATAVASLSFTYVGDVSSDNQLIRDIIKIL